MGCQCACDCTGLEPDRVRSGYCEALSCNPHNDERRYFTRERTMISTLGAHYGKEAVRVMEPPHLRSPNKQRTDSFNILAPGSTKSPWPIRNNLILLDVVKMQIPATSPAR